MDLAAVDGALDWLTVVDTTASHAHTAAEPAALLQRGDPLAARDAFIAGTALAIGERLVVADTDFDVPGLTDALDVDILLITGARAGRRSNTVRTDSLFRCSKPGEITAPFDSGPHPAHFENGVEQGREARHGLWIMGPHAPSAFPRGCAT